MTTLAQAQAELEAALAAVTNVGGLDGVTPPGVIVYGDGVDPAHIVRGQMEAGFRLTFVGGAWDGAASSSALRGVIAAALPILAGLAGWRLGSVTPDSVVRIAGSTLLGADMPLSRMVDI